MGEPLYQLICSFLTEWGSQISLLQPHVGTILDDGLIRIRPPLTAGVIFAQSPNLECSEFEHRM